jgi:hypothetical protein
MAKGKIKAVKWSIGADEPEDLQDFLSNDDIVAKHTVKKGANKGEINWPGKGPFTFKVQFIKMAEIAGGENKGKPRLRIMLVLDEPKKSDASSWNGYAIFDGFNVTEQGTPFLKRFLKAVGVSWDDFYSKTKMDESQDPPHIVQMGKVKFEAGSPVTLRATVVVKPADDYNDDEHLEIGRFLPLDDDEPESDDVEEDDDEDEDDDIEVMDDDDDDDEDEDDDEEDEEDEDDEEDDEDEDEEDEEDDDDDDDEDEEDEEDAEEELRDELSGLKIDALKKRAIRSAKKAKVDTDDMPSKKAALIDWIVNVELGEPPF